MYCRFHVGPAYKDPEIYARTIKEAKTIFERGALLGFDMKILDIGGGFPGGVRRLGTFEKVETCLTIVTILYFIFFFSAI